MATVKFAAAGGSLYAYLAGEIDHDSAQRLRINIDETVSTQMPEELVLDFSGVSFMDSSGVGLILGRQRRLQALGGRLRVQQPPQSIRKILEIANIEVREARS